MHKSTTRHEAEQALKHANRAIRLGAVAEAERWSKTAERLAAAATALDASAPVEDGEAHEARCAELRRRLALYVEADLDFQAWEREAALYEAACAAALANGGPPPAPLRPHPAGAMGEEAYLTAIALGPLPPG